MIRSNSKSCQAKWNWKTLININNGFVMGLQSKETKRSTSLSCILRLWVAFTPSAMYGKERGGILTSHLHNFFCGCQCAFFFKQNTMMQCCIIFSPLPPCLSKLWPHKLHVPFTPSLGFFTQPSQKKHMGEGGGGGEREWQPTVCLGNTNTHL